MAQVELTNSSTIDALDKAIELLQNNPELRNSTLAKNEIERLQATKPNLIKCLQTRYKETQNMDPTKQSEYFMNNSERISYQAGLLDLMKNNYKALSIEKINDLQRKYFRYDKRENLDISNFTKDPSSKTIDFLTGKKMFNLTSILKTSISAAAIAGLAHVNGFSAIAFAMEGLFAINPAFAIIAGVAGVAGLAMLAGKVFGPEIKKYLANRKFKHAIEQNISEVEEQSFNIEEAEKKNKEELQNVDNQNELNDLVFNFSKRIKSVEDLAKLKNQLGNTTIQFTVPGTKNHATVNFDMLIHEPVHVQQITAMFKADAEKFVFDTDKTKVEALRDKYKDFLSEAEMDTACKELGITKGEDFTQSFDDVQNSISKSDEYKKFKDSYDEVVKYIVSGDKTKAIREIKRLDTVSKTVGQKTKVNKIVINKNTGKNETKTEILSEEEAVKLSTLCENMVKMLEELYKQVANDKTKYASEAEAKKAIAEQHGLDAEELDKLLK